MVDYVDLDLHYKVLVSNSFYIFNKTIYLRNFTPLNNIKWITSPQRTPRKRI